MLFRYKTSAFKLTRDGGELKDRRTEHRCHDAHAGVLRWGVWAADSELWERREARSAEFGGASWRHFGG